MNLSDAKVYCEDEMLQLSGIQHYLFCPRQWALIHIDQIWEDNYLTTEGTLLHNNVDNPFYRERGRDNILTLRALRVASEKLGLTGIADAVELHPHKAAPYDKGELIKSKQFEIIPIEFKRGYPKINDCDRMQVAAQAIALEEMFGVSVNQGAIFYWQTRHREYIKIDDNAKERVKNITREMHEIFKSGQIPKVSIKKGCNSCSLKDYCLPSIMKKSAKKYIINSLEELENS